MATPWFGGVCDTLLMRIQAWANKYEQGEIYSTRQYLTKAIERIDLPVQFLHYIPFSKPEMQHLVRILKAERPKADITVYFDKILSIMNNPSIWLKHQNRLKLLASGHFVIALVCEKYEVVELVDLLMAVKEGRSTTESSMESQIAAKKKTGKGMWEN